MRPVPGLSVLGGGITGMTGDSILVLGATGSTGSRVARRLRAAGCPVRAASRAGQVRFDWTAPETWEPAVRASPGST